MSKKVRVKSHKRSTQSGKTTVKSHSRSLPSSDLSFSAADLGFGFGFDADRFYEGDSIEFRYEPFEGGDEVILDGVVLEKHEGGFYTINFSESSMNGLSNSSKQELRDTSIQWSGEDMRRKI